MPGDFFLALSNTVRIRRCQNFKFRLIKKGIIHLNLSTKVRIRRAHIHVIMA